MHEFNLFGDIEDQRWWDSDIIPADIKDFLKKANGEDVVFNINSGGGSVFAGAAMSSMIENYSGQTTARVLGIAASMATHVAMSCDLLEMSNNALWMIHNCAGSSHGEAADHAKSAQLQEKIDSQLVTAYQRKSSLSAEDIKSMMNEETWMTATEAIEAGFVDAVLAPVEIAAHASKGDFKGKISNKAAAYFKDSPKKERKLEQKKEDSLIMDNLTKDEQSTIAAFFTNLFSKKEDSKNLEDGVDKDTHAKVVDELNAAVLAEKEAKEKVTSFENQLKEMEEKIEASAVSLTEEKTKNTELEAKATELEAKNTELADKSTGLTASLKEANDKLEVFGAGLVDPKDKGDADKPSGTYSNFTEAMMAVAEEQEISMSKAFDYCVENHGDLYPKKGK